MPAATDEKPRKKADKPLPAWFGMGRAHVRKNAGRKCGMDEMREAIATGVVAERFAGEKRRS